MFQGNRGEAKKVLMSVHHIDLLKTDPAEFASKQVYIDAWHVPCSKTRNQLAGFTDKPIYQIPYWVNDKIYFPIDDKSGLRKKYNLPIDRIIVGSFQRDTEGSDLISPKLSKGPDIFAEIIIEMSKSFPILVILTSWRRQYLITRFTENDVPFKYFELVDRKTINELYNSLDWYFITSRYEGGPEAVLQCAQTKTRILSTDVGLASEILHEDCICYSRNEFIIKFKEGLDTTEYNYSAVQNYLPQFIIEKYDLLFEGILSTG